MRRNRQHIRLKITSMHCELHEMSMHQWMHVIIEIQSLDTRISWQNSRALKWWHLQKMQFSSEPELQALQLNAKWPKRAIRDNTNDAKRHQYNERLTAFHFTLTEVGSVFRATVYSVSERRTFKLHQDHIRKEGEQQRVNIGKYRRFLTSKRSDTSNTIKTRRICW